VVFLPLGLLTGVEGQFFQGALHHADDLGARIAGLALSIIPLLSEQYLTAADAEGPMPLRDLESFRGRQPRNRNRPGRGALARVGAAIDRVSDRYERATHVRCCTTRDR
jgi:hypothetical protein